MNRMPTVNIKGKDYVLVKDRILFFNENFPNGRIETEILKHEGGKTIIKAKVTPDVKNPDRFFIGHSQANEEDGYINKTSAVENCETSAVGRALAMMGIGVIDSIASVDEIKKVGVTECTCGTTNRFHSKNCPMFKKV